MIINCIYVIFFFLPWSTICLKVDRTKAANLKLNYKSRLCATIEEKDIDTSGKGFGKKVIPPPKLQAIPLQNAADENSKELVSIRQSKTPRQIREEELEAKMAQLKEEEDLLATGESSSFLLFVRCPIFML